jgi:hypothetical protein
MTRVAVGAVAVAVLLALASPARAKGRDELRH